MAAGTAGFAPVVVETKSPAKLAMQRLWLTGRVLPAGARLIVQHVFRADEKKPLEVIYAFPLPRDAALRRFRITGDGFDVQSELREADAARRTYEEGLAQGSLSTLAAQYGDGLVNLTIGNIRPKETVTVYLEIVAGVESNDQGFRFRFPFTLAPTYHSSAKAAVIEAGEGEMELPPDQFGDVILPRFREDAASLHAVGFDLEIVTQADLDEIGSPSHAVRVRQDSPGSRRVVLAAEKDVPNRDLVLDAHFKETGPQILGGRDKDGRGHFVAVVPSSMFGTKAESPRRIVVLLDRSGSMEGEPLSQAVKAIKACLGVLSESDLFGIVAFDNAVEMFDGRLMAGAKENRERAHQFLDRIDARGGTELAEGFLQAAKLLDGPGDIFILTDGQVSGTEQILARARSAGVRLHCLGIGSASQDRFLTLLARETGGVSRFVTARERVDMSAVDLFASIGRPVASGLKATGNIQPEPPSVVFSGTAVVLFGESEAEGDGAIELTWDGGHLNIPVSFGATDAAETVSLLQGSRLITDWESRYPSSEALGPLDKRKQSRAGNRLRQLSEQYGLASREMSLVAVVKREGDRPGDLPETRVVPVGMPQDTQFEAYFNRQHALRAAMSLQRSLNVDSSRASFAGMEAMASFSPPTALPSRMGRIRKTLDKVVSDAESPTDQLFDLATRIEPDGGMPGQDPEARAAATIAALFAFLSQGHTLSAGVFRSHVARRVSFLKTLKLSGKRQDLVARAIERAEAGTAPAGDWIAMACDSGKHWNEIESAIGS